MYLKTISLSYPLLLTLPPYLSPTDVCMRFLDECPWDRLKALRGELDLIPCYAIHCCILSFLYSIHLSPSFLSSLPLCLLSTGLLPSLRLSLLRQPLPFLAHHFSSVSPLFVSPHSSSSNPFSPFPSSSCKSLFPSCFSPPFTSLANIPSPAQCSSLTFFSIAISLLFPSSSCLSRCLSADAYQRS